MWLVWLSQCLGDHAGDHSVGKLLLSRFGILGLKYRHSIDWPDGICHCYHLISVHFRPYDMLDCYDVFLTYFLFRPILLRSVRVIAHVFCCAGMLVCLFVVTVADFGLSHWKLGYRILNCIINFWSLILVSNFSLGGSSSFYQSHFCCSYCFIYSFPFGIRLCWLLLWSVFCLSEWYNIFCENWAGVRWHN